MRKMQKNKKIVVFVIIIMLVFAAAITVFGVRQFQRNRLYGELRICFEQGKYAEAERIIYELGEYKDAKKLLPQCQDMGKATTLMEQNEYEEAREIYQQYKMENEINECTYQIAISYADSKEYEKALQEFTTISSYKDVVDRAKAIDYDYALTLYNKQQYSEAKIYFEDADNYKDAVEFVEKCDIGIKYEKCKLDTSQFNTNDPIEMYSYVEDQLVGCFYFTWYDVNGKELVINKESINGIPYQVISIETNGSYPVFKFNFVNDSTQHTISRLSPVADAEAINFMENISFDSSTYYEYKGKKQKKIIEAALEWEEQLRQAEEAEKQQKFLQENAIKIACRNDVLNYYNSEGKNSAEQLFVAFNAWQVYNETIRISGSNCIFECDVSQIWNFGLHGHRVEAQYLIDENGNIQRKSIINK